MNYTYPEGTEGSDTPQDWLGSALIFANALGHILPVNHGIVVKLQNDMWLDRFDPDTDMVIVWVSESQIHMDQIRSIDYPNYKEGDAVMMATNSEN